VSGDEAVTLGSCAMDVVQVAALRGRAGELERLAASRGVQLPALGQIAIASDHLALGARPERWLILTARAAPGAATAGWLADCSGVATVVDLSSGLSAFNLTGSVVPEVLARGCRLDLNPQAFPAQRTAVTIMAQVSVIVAALHSSWLLLTPSSTARHFHEWLVSAAQPFGLSARGGISIFERAA
jgi:heterotetrameric sarcosine oxidase gamma subunit